MAVVVGYPRQPWQLGGHMPYSEDFLDIRQLCARYPGRSGGRLNPATPWRWITRGLLLPDSTRVYLRAVRVGARWMIRESDWERFLAALTSANAGPADPTPPPRSAHAREKASEAALRELERLGL